MNKKVHLIVKDPSGKKWVHLENEGEETERMKEEIPLQKCYIWFDPSAENNLSKVQSTVVITERQLKNNHLITSKQMLVDKQSELMTDLLFIVHQHGGDDVTWKPPIKH